VIHAAVLTSLSS